MADKVTLRRQAKMATILGAAWNLARENGVAAVSLHALARDVGMRQPSLYEYFDSKHALYDAMFAEGNQQLLDRLGALEPFDDPRAALKAFLGVFATFAVDDPARYELLFERHVPGFTPSPESYALAEEVLERSVTVIRAAGVTEQGDIDCIVAVTAGLIAAQLSNDPGGRRWVRHLDRLVDLLVDDARTRSTNT
jgi:AcrR family transcriptional regulator